jgi:hypothetical protein
MSDKTRQAEEVEEAGQEPTGLLLTSAEAAALLGMSVRGFHRAVKRTGGTLKPHPASGKFRHWYSRAKVIAWAAEEPEAVAEPKGDEA